MCVLVPVRNHGDWAQAGAALKFRLRLHLKRPAPAPLKKGRLQLRHHLYFTSTYVVFVSKALLLDVFQIRKRKQEDSLSFSVIPNTLFLPSIIFSLCKKWPKWGSKTRTSSISAPSNNRTLLSANIPNEPGKTKGQKTFKKTWEMRGTLPAFQGCLSGQNSLRGENSCKLFYC